MQTLPTSTGHLAPGFLGSTGPALSPLGTAATQLQATCEEPHSRAPSQLVLQATGSTRTSLQTLTGHLVAHPWGQLSEVSPPLEKESTLMRIIWGHRDYFRQDGQVSPVPMVTSHSHSWSRMSFCPVI